MKYLVRVSGDLCIPCYKCSAGNTHYSETEIEPVEINVAPQRSALRYLRLLIGKIKSPYFKDYEFPTDRINLLYTKEGDSLKIDLMDIIDGPEFDFFVKGNGEQKRFRYIHGSIFNETQRLDKAQKVRELFGHVSTLELTYVGSPYVELVERYDYQVEDVWESYMREKNTKKIKGELKKHIVGADYIVDKDIFDARVLLAFADIPISNGPLSIYDVIDVVKDDGYDCPCWFDDCGGIDDVKFSLEYLVKEGFLKKVPEGFVMAAKHKRREIQEELEYYLSNVKGFADNNLLGAGILLSLVNEPGSLKDISKDIRNYGFDYDPYSLQNAVEELCIYGFLKEEDGIFKIAPEYIRPIKYLNQLKLDI